MSIAQSSGALAAADVPAPRRRARRGRFFALRLVAAVVITLIMVFPLYWMVLTAFSPRSELYAPGLRLWPRELTFENFTIPFARFPVAAWFVNSFLVTVAVTVISVAVNLLAGYAFAKLPFRGKNVLFLVLLSTMMIPVQAIMVPQYRLSVQLGLYGQLLGVILPESAAVFGIFLARQFFLAIPDELLEAARMDGAGPFRTFVTIVLPLARPLLAVLTLLAFMTEWNAFAWPLVVLFGNEQLFTLPLGLVTDLQGQYTSNYGAIMAIGLLMVLPVVVLFLAFQRYFVQGFVNSGIR